MDTTPIGAPTYSLVKQQITSRNARASTHSGAMADSWLRYKMMCRRVLSWLEEVILKVLKWLAVIFVDVVLWNLKPSICRHGIILCAWPVSINGRELVRLGHTTKSNNIGNTCLSKWVYIPNTKAQGNLAHAKTLCHPSSCQNIQRTLVYFSFKFIHLTVWVPMSFTISSAAYGCPWLCALRLIDFKSSLSWSQKPTSWAISDGSSQ